MSISADQKVALETQAVNNFREYLQIPSVHPDVNYDDCVKFLRNQAEGLGLPVKVVSPIPGKPIVIITWTGTESNLPSILLNSHMDVVPVFEEHWTHKPFAADIDDKGNIFARGAQDMKCVGIQYLEAIRRLKLEGAKPKRTIHISFVPDEEIGGVLGMREFIRTDEFKALNVGFALDEGMANPNNDFFVFHGERAIWHIEVHCSGSPGHGSLLMEGTAGEKVSYLLNKFFELRKQEKKKLEENKNLTLGDVMTVNLTIMKGGVQGNVVPPQFYFMIDNRIPVTVDHKKWEEKIKQWCKEAGSGITLTYEQKDPSVPVTKLDNSNPFWMAFKNVADSLKLKLTPQIFPGGTDSRFLREIGIPAIGYSPINNTPILLHDHDEYLNKTTFLTGIDIYCKLIKAISNVDDRTG